MDAGRIATAAAGVVLIVCYAAGSGWLVSTNDDWYQALESPSWQPPDAVFGLIWPYNFVALAAVSIAVATQGTSTETLVWLVGLAASVAAALTWAWLFYESHALWGAALSLSLAALVTVAIVIVAFRVRTWAGVVLLPYQVWLVVAASLSVGYARLN